LKERSLSGEGILFYYETLGQRIRHPAGRRPLLLWYATSDNKTKALIPHLSFAIVGKVNILENSIMQRFAKVFQSNDAIVAAITLPKFKLRWVDDQ